MPVSRYESALPFERNESAGLKNVAHAGAVPSTCLATHTPEYLFSHPYGTPRALPLA